MTYSHMGSPTLPSALGGFTSEFGMGSGGSRPLWSSGEKGCGKQVCLVLRGTGSSVDPEHALGCYIVKPHEPLVPVSLTPCSASTPGLSTSWSWTALEGPRGPGEISSWKGLPA